MRLGTEGRSAATLLRNQHHLFLFEVRRFLGVDFLCISGR
jgi:hypothetical protein